MNQEEPAKITSYSFRNFVRRLNNAAIRKNYREQRLDEIGSRMRELSDHSSEERPKNKVIEKELRELDMKIRDLAAEEKVLVVRERNDQGEIDSLKQRIRELEEKIEGLSHVHSAVADAHHRRIAELQNALARANAENGQLRRTPTEEIHRFILEKVKPMEEMMEKREKSAAQEKISGQPVKKIHPAVIRSLQKRISDAEKLHEKLKKKGHPKEDLKRLKDVIDSHKEKLKNINN